MTLEHARRAIALWDLPQSDIELAAERENMVFRVTNASGTYALRLHRDGYRNDAELVSELAWMAAIQSRELSVPKPVPAKNGTHLQISDNRQFDLLTWLPGRQLGTRDTGLDLEHPLETFRTLGRAMAHLHLKSDAWTAPPGFTRPVWDRNGLLGEAPLWGRFWDNPDLSAHNRKLLQAFRSKARHCLANGNHDFGLIHADLLRENILVDANRVHLIDFDDGGYGYRLFELATTILRIKHEPGEAELTTALIEGYREIRAIDVTGLPLFIALRACSYVGWIVTRMEIANAATRNMEYIEEAAQTAAEFLETEAQNV